MTWLHKFFWLFFIPAQGRAKSAQQLILTVLPFHSCIFHASDPNDFIVYLYISSLEVSRVFLECGVTNQSSSIIDFQWLPLCIKIIALCLVMHYANWLIESQVWELLFKSQFGFSTDLIRQETSIQREKKSVANCHTNAQRTKIRWSYRSFG